MKTIFKSLAFIVVITMLLSACKKMTPVACFTEDNATITAGGTVNFDGSCSEETHHWEWDFGDGATGEGTTVAHIYNNAGSYTVTLTAHDMDMELMDEESHVITVN